MEPFSKEKKKTKTKTKTKTQFVFSLDKLQSAVTMVNSQVEESHDKKGDAENIMKKNIKFFKSYLDECKSCDTKDIIKTLRELLHLNKSFFINYGDELSENLWSLYDDQFFQIDQIASIQTFYEYFLHLFFMNSPNLNLLLQNNLFCLNTTSKAIECPFDVNIFITLEEKFTYWGANGEATITSSNYDHSAEISHKNFLIDVLFFTILSNAELKIVYTSLSSFLMTIKSSVMRFYKVISLFALCLWRLEKKENFISSLLYIIGGVLRDLARSYLKTKGVLNENLSYFTCKHKEKHDNHFFAPKLLIGKECAYLEMYFLPTMNEFLKLISSDLKISDNLFWDDYLTIFSKQLEIEESDQEDCVSPPGQIFHFISLFLSDFIFFFFTNFCGFDSSSYQFSSHFSNFQDFMDYSLSLISTTCRNPFNMFEFSEKKRRVLEIDCEKTEYSLKDNFNHYGMCLIFFCFLNGQFQRKQVLKCCDDEKCKEYSFLPLVIRRDNFSSVYHSAMYMIIKTENHSEHKFMKNYLQYCISFIQWMQKSNLLDQEIKVGFPNYSVMINALYEFGLVNSFLTDEQIKTLAEVLRNITDKDISLCDIVLMETKNESYVKSLLDFYLRLLPMVPHQMDQTSIMLLIRHLTSRGFILNNQVVSLISALIETNCGKESLKALVPEYLTEIKALDVSSGANEILMTNRDEVIRRLEKIIT